MPSFFARRYMRGKPRRTERLVGAFVLGLLALIVGLFALTGGLFANVVHRVPLLTKAKDAVGISERPLFVPDPKNVKPPAPPHEARIAQQLLPEQLSDWTRVELRTWTGGTRLKENAPALWVAVPYEMYYRGAYVGQDGELVVVVLEGAKPSEARAIFQKLDPAHAARPVSIACGGWIDEPNQRAAFWAGRYCTLVLMGRDSSAKILEQLLRTLASRQLIYCEEASDLAGVHPQPGHLTSRSQATGGDLQPASAAGHARFADVVGLDAPGRIERYSDNLYEKIDGREPMFRSFNFVELRFGQYLDGRNKLAYDVYLYDMAEPNNALGIYMKERSGAGAPAGVGRDSYVSGTNVYFWKGKYYVNVLAPADGGDAALATAKRIASAIAETIADTGGGFWAEDVLPREDRVEGSFKYIASSALGYDFLNRVYRADYKTKDKTYGLFVLKASSPERARELYIQLADAAKRYGDDIEQRVDTPGSELVVTRSLDMYMVAFCKGVFVGGVADCDDKELALEKAKLLRERMPADAPGEPEPAAAGGEGSASEGEGQGQSKPEDGESRGESNGY